MHPNEYSQKLHYYPFWVTVDRDDGNCNIINDLPNKVCVSNKTEDLNTYIFNMITGINKSKVLTKHITCKCKSKFDRRNYNSNRK